MTFADFSLCMAATNHYQKENCVAVGLMRILLLEHMLVT